jgi:hypothetical protein
MYTFNFNKLMADGQRGQTGRPAQNYATVVQQKEQEDVIVLPQIPMVNSVREIVARRLRVTKKSVQVVLRLFIYFIT